MSIVLFDPDVPSASRAGRRPVRDDPDHVRRRERARVLAEEGYRFREIAERLGVTDRTLRNWRAMDARAS